MHSFFKLLWCALALSASSALQAQTFEVKDSTGKVVLVFENDRVKEAGSNQILYTIKANIIFQGASEQTDDIKLLVQAENFFSKKKVGEIYDASQKDPLFSVREGGFYYRDNSTYLDEWMMAHYRKEEGGGIGLYSGTSDTLIAYFPTQEVSTGKLAAVFYYFSRKLQWEEKMSLLVVTPVEPYQPTASPELEAVRQTSGTIRKLWNTGMEEFVWDGEVLKRKWNSFDYEEWTFDGTTLKRLWYPGQEEMEWDGQVLRRKWYSSPDEFEWDGTTLRRRYGSITDGFIIQGNIIKRTFENDLDSEWEIDGNIPIPVIMIVVFELLKK